MPSARPVRFRFGSRRPPSRPAHRSPCRRSCVLLRGDRQRLAHAQRHRGPGGRPGISARASPSPRRSLFAVEGLHGNGGPARFFAVITPAALTVTTLLFRWKTQPGRRARGQDPRRTRSPPHAQVRFFTLSDTFDGAPQHRDFAAVGNAVPVRVTVAVPATLAVTRPVPGSTAATWASRRERPAAARGDLRAVDRQPEGLPRAQGQCPGVQRMRRLGLPGRFAALRRAVARHISAALRPASPSPPRPSPSLLGGLAGGVRSGGVIGRVAGGKGILIPGGQGVAQHEVLHGLGRGFTFGSRRQAVGYSSGTLPLPPAPPPPWPPPRAAARLRRLRVRRWPPARGESLGVLPSSAVQKSGHANSANALAMASSPSQPLRICHPPGNERGIITLIS